MVDCMRDAEDQYAGIGSAAVETSARVVYANLKDAIAKGALHPGQRLVEARIAGRLGVSRAPLREAIRLLESEGLLQKVPRKGVIVSILHEKDAAEIYGLRVALESWAAREACHRATEADFEALRELIAEMERSSSASDVDHLAGEDVTFHRKICEIAGNQRLLISWTGIVSQMRLLSRHVLGTLYADLHQVPHRHERLMEALAKREPDLAEVLIRQHIESVASRILDEMRAAESEIRRRSYGT